VEAHTAKVVPGSRARRRQPLSRSLIPLAKLLYTNYSTVLLHIYTSDSVAMTLIAIGACYVDTILTWVVPTLSKSSWHLKRAVVLIEFDQSPPLSGWRWKTACIEAKPPQRWKLSEHSWSSWTIVATWPFERRLFLEFNFRFPFIIVSGIQSDTRRTWGSSSTRELHLQRTVQRTGIQLHHHEPGHRE